MTEPLSRLLHDARRTSPDAADGEQDVLGAYRWSQQASSAAQTTLVLDRGPRQRTIAVRRFVAAKVLAVAAVTVAIGGVALAGTLHNLPGPVAATNSETSSGPAPAGAVDSTTPSEPTASAARDAATSEPSTTPAASSRPSTTKPVSTQVTAVQRLTRGERVRMARICRAWLTDSKRGVPATQKTAEALYRAAGGKEKALGFCVDVVDELCTPWKAKVRGAWQCPYALDPTTPPVVPPTRPAPAPTDKTTLPFPAGPGDPEPRPVITGGPVINRVAG